MIVSIFSWKQLDRRQSSYTLSEEVQLEKSAIVEIIVVELQVPYEYQLYFWNSSGSG